MIEDILAEATVFNNNGGLLHLLSHLQESLHLSVWHVLALLMHDTIIRGMKRFLGQHQILLDAVYASLNYPKEHLLLLWPCFLSLAIQLISSLWNHNKQAVYWGLANQAIS
jgi:hypothetical protein